MSQRKRHASSKSHFLHHIVLIQRKCFSEHPSELVNLAVQFGAVRPVESGLSNSRRTPSITVGICSPNVSRLILCVLELALVYCVDDAPHHRGRATLARAEPATGPTSTVLITITSS
jgi:hypothetical protein